MSFAAGGIKVSDVDIAQSAYNAGFRGTALTEIVARCWIESSGYADIINDSSGAAGLWQILPSAHPEDKSNLPPNKGWMDPQTNANMAYAIYVAAGVSMSPWASDGSAWLVNLPRAQAAVAQINTTGGSSGSSSANPNVSGANSSGSIPATAVSNPITGVADAVKFVIDPHNWFRVAMFILGGALLLWGIWELMKDTSFGTAIKSTAREAKEAGKAAGVAALA